MPDPVACGFDSRTISDSPSAQYLYDDTISSTDDYAGADTFHAYITCAPV